MKTESTTIGWVICSVNGTFILEHTFSRTRSAAIKKWMSYWDSKRTSWRKFKKEGYKCKKAKQTTEIL
ncbi:hypothetical protein [Tenacibaculum singaporense]|uniref:hypothetical protein n=1 Tax=Tenacibaculum singaporense TaxID=2358479 RepID=UPI000F67E026|nr:hypothetical protein [Tenacibaculum singaporense]RSC96041.1 hypothetical protein EI424_02670 [Tenacibaculum singaporense]